MPNLKEITWSLYGCYKLAIRDKDALSFFNFSASGFWASFSAVFLALFLTAIQELMKSRYFPDDTDVFQFIILIVLAITVSWIFYLAAVGLVSKYMGFSQNYSAFIIVYNWSQLAVIAAWFILSVLTLGLLGPDALKFVGLLFIGLTYTYLWYILVATLKVSALTAIALTIMEFSISIFIQQTVLQMFL